MLFYLDQIYLDVTSPHLIITHSGLSHLHLVQNTVARVLNYRLNFKTFLFVEKGLNHFTSSYVFTAHDTELRLSNKDFCPSQDAGGVMWSAISAISITGGLFVIRYSHWPCVYSISLVFLLPYLLSQPAGTLRIIILFLLFQLY